MQNPTTQQEEDKNACGALAKAKQGLKWPKMAKITATTTYIDSQSALAVGRNPIFHARTKHIEVHYHYVRERLSAGETNLVYVPTQDNLVDLFAKALPCEKFEAFCKALGLLPFVDWL